MDAVPLLNTSRLRLREPTASDFNDYASLCADAEVMRYVGDRGPLSRDDAWRQLTMLVGHWALARPFWGRGYAFEAATAALRFAFDTLGWSRAISLIAPLNLRSIRLAERLGEGYEQNVVVRGMRSACMRSSAGTGVPPEGTLNLCG
jgi:RimJ/RimL family protein N-acetyltransferase